MSIVITNMGGIADSDECSYAVKINAKVITHFTHRRIDGLAECLKKAANAVSDQHSRDILAMLEAASKEQSHD